MRVVVKCKTFIVDFHFLGISQNSFSLIVFVVLILINKLLFDRFKCKTLDYFQMLFKFSI